MRNLFFSLSLMAGTLGLSAQAVPGFESDIFETARGPARITFVGHASLMIQWNGLVIHVDPVSAEADYSLFPRADILLVTHEHGDHFDPAVMKLLSGPDTRLVTNASVTEKYGTGTVMANGDTLTVRGISLQAVPAFNTTPGRERFHPRGRDNGFVLDMGGFRLYIAGDTEPVPEMKTLADIDAAFLPVNQPYTMTPEQAAEAARQIRPAVLYPYHYGQTDLSGLAGSLKASGVEVRIRKLD